MAVRIINGDCRAVLPMLEAGSFDCIVSSPPYWGLRSYLPEGHDDKHREIGLEPTLDAYVETMADLGDLLWRVLKPGGTFWLNLGDSYSMSTKGSSGKGDKQVSNAGTIIADRKWAIQRGLKPKDLCGVPWRVAFSLQARGWWLRSAIVWHKPNPMPESVTDRPTSAYEMVFLLTKSERYYYDADAIAEVACGAPEMAIRHGSSETVQGPGGGYRVGSTSGMRNARNVWTIATQPYRGSHFATMPPDLAERCIKAGCPRGGLVLDPFGGAGTTGLVADRLGRHATLIELNPAYQEMASNRVADDAGLFAEVDSSTGKPPF